MNLLLLFCFFFIKKILFFVWCFVIRLDKYQKKRSKYPVEDWPKRYKPVRPLGKGHDGMCYLCHDGETGELVAVKVLNPKRNRKITEPSIMKGLKHRHIVCMRDHFLIRSYNFLVLDFAEKGDLCKQLDFFLIFFFYKKPPVYIFQNLFLNNGNGFFFVEKKIVCCFFLFLSIFLYLYM